MTKPRLRSALMAVAAAFTLSSIAEMTLTASSAYAAGVSGGARGGTGGGMKGGSGAKAGRTSGKSVKSGRPNAMGRFTRSGRTTAARSAALKANNRGSRRSYSHDEPYYGSGTYYPNNYNYWLYSHGGGSHASTSEATQPAPVSTQQPAPEVDEQFYVTMHFACTPKEDQEWDMYLRQCGTDDVNARYSAVVNKGCTPVGRESVVMFSHRCIVGGDVSTDPQ